jgi:hypothetical protein
VICHDFDEVCELDTSAHYLGGYHLSEVEEQQQQINATQGDLNL